MLDFCFSWVNQGEKDVRLESVVLEIIIGVLPGSEGIAGGHSTGHCCQPTLTLLSRTRHTRDTTHTLASAPLVISLQFFLALKYSAWQSRLTFKLGVRNWCCQWWWSSSINVAEFPTVIRKRWREKDYLIMCNSKRMTLRRRRNRQWDIQEDLIAKKDMKR